MGGSQLWVGGETESERKKKKERARERECVRDGERTR